MYYCNCSFSSAWALMNRPVCSVLIPKRISNLKRCWYTVLDLLLSTFSSDLNVLSHLSLTCVSLITNGGCLAICESLLVHWRLIGKHCQRAEPCALGCITYNGTRCSYDFIMPCTSGNRLACFVSRKLSFPPCPRRQMIWNDNGRSKNKVFLIPFILVSKRYALMRGFRIWS